MDEGRFVLVLKFVGEDFGGERVSTDETLRAINVVNSDADAKRYKSPHQNEHETGTRRACWFWACLLKNVFRSTRHVFLLTIAVDMLQLVDDDREAARLQ